MRKVDYNKETYRLSGDTRLTKLPLIIGIVGLALSAIGYSTNHEQFFHSYLTSYIFWLSIGWGGLFFTMIHHLTGAVWSVVIRRISETLMMTIPWMALLFLPLIELSPIGGIPGVPTFLAVMIALIAGQRLFGREHGWLPDFVERRAIDGDRLAHGAHRLDNVAATIDGWFHGRLKWLTRGIWPRVAALVVVLLCCAVPPLEFLPFASSAPMIAIAAFGLALMVRDGLLMVIAFAISTGAVAVVAGVLTSGGSG